MTGPGDATVEILGERLVLMPERTVFWPAEHTLLLADPHWGKAATFRARGIPLPHGTTLGGIHRLEHALARSQARRVVFLGDFLHAEPGRAAHVLETLAAWRARFEDVEMLLVRGNHDRHAGDPWPELGIICRDPPVAAPPFDLRHEPVPGERYHLAGHLHPAVRVRGRGRLDARLPCFWFGEHGAVLPAFGEFTGHAEIRPEPGDRVFVVAAEAVLPLG